MSIAGIRRNDLTAVVGRAVIHNNQLEVLKRLVQYAVKTFLEIGSMIVVRNNDTD
jgi:hypothetical protein